MTTIVQALLLLAQRMENHEKSIVQFGIDLAAVQRVLAALDARAAEMMAAEAVRLRGMFEAQLLASRQEFEALRKAIAGLNGQKPPD